jgi:hypothetical protein
MVMRAKVIDLQAELPTNSQENGFANKIREGVHNYYNSNSPPPYRKNIMADKITRTGLTIAR